MDTDASINSDIKEQLQFKVSADSCIVDFVKAVTLARDTGGSSTAECVSGDWYDQVTEVDSDNLKQEPDDVCCLLCLYLYIYCNKVTNSIYTNL